jgi:hypothetical protein
MATHTFGRNFALGVLGFVLLAGCGQDVPQPIDTLEAGRQLDTALTAWKAAEPYEGLAARNPSVIFNEPLWQSGTALLSFVREPVELEGRQGRCAAKLTLREKSGKQYERRIVYTIDTVPRIVIVREDLGL